MKPNWEDAPKWAQWFAIDGDGHAYFHQRMPELLVVHLNWRNGGYIAYAGRFDVRDETECHLSLQMRPI